MAIGFWDKIGNTIKIARENENLSLRQVAKLADVSYTTINLIENGNQKAPIDTLRKICNAFRLSSTRRTH